MKKFKKGDKIKLKPSARKAFIGNSFLSEYTAAEQLLVTEVVLYESGGCSLVLALPDGRTHQWGESWVDFVSRPYKKRNLPTWW
jgi:hypothetical protein